MFDNCLTPDEFLAVAGNKNGEWGVVYADDDASFFSAFHQAKFFMELVDGTALLHLCKECGWVEVEPARPVCTNDHETVGL